MTIDELKSKVSQGVITVKVVDLYDLPISGIFQGNSSIEYGNEFEVISAYLHLDSEMKNKVRLKNLNGDSESFLVTVIDNNKIPFEVV